MPGLEASVKRESDAQGDYDLTESQKFGALGESAIRLIPTRLWIGVLPSATTFAEYRPQFLLHA
jgi:hypothetical protein